MAPYRISTFSSFYTVNPQPRTQYFHPHMFVNTSKRLLPPYFSPIWQFYYHFSHVWRSILWGFDRLTSGREWYISLCYFHNLRSQIRTERAQLVLRSYQGRALLFGSSGYSEGIQRLCHVLLAGYMYTLILTRNQLIGPYHRAVYPKIHQVSTQSEEVLQNTRNTFRLALSDITYSIFIMLEDFQQNLKKLELNETLI